MTTEQITDESQITLTNAEVRRWVGKSKVLYSGVAKDGHCFWVACKSERAYHLCRFFCLAGGVASSIDIETANAETFITQLVRKLG